MNKFLRCDTFKEANRKATEIFEKEKTNIYIFECRDLSNPNYPYYYVITNESIAHTDDKIVELIKHFNPEN
jgi:hypothetical protein